tara:strand:- start:6326 stop:7150 length:825 start_codon:yes stop_codon:yes gene_type:complete
MSIKSFIQIFILLSIILIISVVYYNYFSVNKKKIEEINSSEIINQELIKKLEKKILDLEINNKVLNDKIEENAKNSDVIPSETNLSKSIEKKVDESSEIILQEKQTEEEKQVKKSAKESITKNKKIKNLVKDVEYTSIDQKGNKFHLLANSGKSNKDNNDILDLINVRGKITSNIRDTIYIVSDFAQYNSVNLNSKFYENVIINYQDKEITCVNFDINMETNKAIAYNNVLITDPKSIMKAGLVEFDLKTKDININPEITTKEVEVITQTNGVN